MLGDKEQVKRKSKKQEGGELGYQVSSEEKEMSPGRCPPADRSAVSGQTSSQAVARDRCSRLQYPVPVQNSHFSLFIDTERKGSADLAKSPPTRLSRKNFFTRWHFIPSHPIQIAISPQLSQPASTPCPRDYNSII